MKTKFLVVLVLLMIVAPTWGTEFKSGSTVSIPSGSTVPDDLFAFAQNVDVSGTIDGDLVASGGSLTLSGTTTQDAIVGGGQVTITGRVGRNLLAAGGNLQVSGPVSNNAVIAGGTVTLSSKGSVGRDLTASGGNLRVEGSVARNLNAGGGQVTINGKVGGNVMANAQTLSIGPNAVIQGDLVYKSAKKADIAPGAQIRGRTIYHPITPTHRRARPVMKALFWVGSFLAMFLVGILLIALAPAAAAGSADRMISRPWISLLIGFIILVVMPVAIAIIFATLIGIPLALILLAAYLIMLYIARAYAAIGIGRWILARFGSPNASLYLDLLVGLIILWLLTAIPFVGWFIGLLALLFGLGALSAQRCALMRDMRCEGKL